MTLKELIDLLIQMPTLCTVDDVAAEVRCSAADVVGAAADGISLGYIDVRPMPLPVVPPPRLISLTPLGAERAGVVLIDVRIDRGDDWAEEPRWLPREMAWWLLQDARRMGYPVIEDDVDFDAQVHRDAHEPLEYLILNEDAEKRRAADSSILPYPLHFYGSDMQWPLVAIPETPGVDAKKGLAADGTDGPCPACGRLLADPDAGDPVGYCDWCDAYGQEARLPKVTRRPPAHRAQLSPRCSLKGGRGPSKTVQRYKDRAKKKARRAG